ncbi:MAG: hypothetical protein EHM72_10685 [Calditrichaeota bacterium]|nr:MAG: hypothetical protein EHM72_10685 [Calditrichota bacterium]
MNPIYGLLLGVLFLSCSSSPPEYTIQTSTSASDLEGLAAKEIARYLYLCSGGKSINLAHDEPSADIYVVIQDTPFDRVLQSTFTSLPQNKLSAQAYAIHTVLQNDQKKIIIRGANPIGTLYGAYRFIESLGVRFYLHDDVLPEKKPFTMPDIHLTESPQFELRGIQPFHDFPEGPDWWNLDDYKAIIGQMVKMRMNFIGFHTYPSSPFRGWSKPEPMVWHGVIEQIENETEVNAAYPVLHFHTMDSTWAYDAKRTSDYHFGAEQIYDADDYGADYMKGISPWPHREAENLRIFNQFGMLQRDVFTFAQRMSVKTCIGTETPLIIPEPLKKQLQEQGIDPNSASAVLKIYEGTFERIKRLHPLDYYWFWTPEYWTWQDVPDADVAATQQDLWLALEAAKRIKAPFTLATCGWVLGPPKDRAQFDRVLPKDIPFSCINREVGFTPVDSNFARIQGRPTWSVSWLEDDPALISPQLWVGRVRQDAVDALTYGCTGFMGIHWRTEILSPALSAVAQAGWTFGDWQGAGNHNTRDLPVDDFYHDWATAHFGDAAGAEIAEIFTQLDGGPLFVPGKNQRQANLYRTSDWAGKGPGGILINTTPWSEVQKHFDFIEELESLQTKISAPAQRERFDYWLNTFRYDRLAAHVGCMLGELESLAKVITLEKEQERRLQLVTEHLLPLKASVEVEWGNMITLLLTTVNTSGAMGTITNFEQHNLLNLRRLSKYDSLASVILGAEAPPSAFWREYRGRARLIVPTRRYLLEKGEPLRLKAIVLGASPANVCLHWRRLGDSQFRRKEFIHSTRGVYRLELPADRMEGGLEYYIEARAKDLNLKYPITAPETNHSVIIW